MQRDEWVAGLGIHVTTGVQRVGNCPVLTWSKTAAAIKEPAKEFPESAEIRQRILRFIAEPKKSGAAGAAYYENALRELNSETE